MNNLYFINLLFITVFLSVECLVYSKIKKLFNYSILLNKPDLVGFLIGLVRKIREEPDLSR